MAERSLMEKLDLAVSAMLERRNSFPVSPDAEIAALLGLAASLRDLPRPDFKARLRADLEKEIPMSTAAAVKPVREGFHTVTLYLAVRQAEELLAFVKQAFGAEQTLRSSAPEGMHAEVRIGDSMLMIGGGPKMRHESMPAGIWLFVPDADETYRKALAAGATSTHEPVDQPYGTREACVRDVAGNDWYISTDKTGMVAQSGLQTITPYFHVKGAAGMIDFLKRAFNAEQTARHDSPTGTVEHAQVKIGDSVIALGDANRFPARPYMLMMYVADCDALYQQALAAGATSITPVAETPYGARVGAVLDAFGNMWYIATQVKEIPA